MADYDIRPLQLKILEILQAVDKTCKEHNLRYYLTAGTMLGAIRHKGFIPWDDDADIAMPRPDYEKLIANAKEWMPKQYELICAENDKNYSLPFAKIQDAETTIIEHSHLRYLGGVYMDVFPLDGLPDNKIVRYFHVRRYKKLRKKLYFTYRDPYRHGHGPACWLPLLHRKLYTVEGLQQKIRELLLKYNYDNSTLVQDYDDGHKGAIRKEILGTPTPYIFENVELKGYENYDAYLSQKYGDYMTPPDGKHQIQHNFYYLDLEHPYREYHGEK
ncbi:MAG: LicD family protein [Salinivirgaceae bacterium]|nr:LicD family protein [Salinivirgaceae bacterium]